MVYGMHHTVLNVFQFYRYGHGMPCHYNSQISLVLQAFLFIGFSLSNVHLIWLLAMYSLILFSLSSSRMMCSKYPRCQSVYFRDWRKSFIAFVVADLKERIIVGNEPFTGLPKDSVFCCRGTACRAPTIIIMWI